MVTDVNAVGLVVCLEMELSASRLQKLGFSIKLCENGAETTGTSVAQTMVTPASESRWEITTAPIRTVMETDTLA